MYMNMYYILLTEWEVCMEEYFAQGLYTDRGQNILPTDQPSSVNKEFIKWLHLYANGRKMRETIQIL